MTNYSQEPFKISLKSMCLRCSNINERCSFVSKTCETDSKIGKGYVSRCSMFNKDMNENKIKEKYIVTVDNAQDSRIEMMGGGFKE